MLGRRLRVMVGTARGRQPAPRPEFRAGSPGVVRSGTMEWRSEGRLWSPVWTLWAEGEAVATLQMLGVMRWSGVVETPTAHWRLRRRGWLGLHEIAREGEEEHVLRFRPGLFRGGRIERKAGSMLRFKPGFLGRSAALVDEGGFVMLTVRRLGGPFRLHGETALEEAGRRLPDAEPLVVLAWWLMLAHHRRRGQ